MSVLTRFFFFSLFEQGTSSFKLKKFVLSKALLFLFGIAESIIGNVQLCMLIVFNLISTLYTSYFVSLTNVHVFGNDKFEFDQLSCHKAAPKFMSMITTLSLLDSKH